MKVLSALFAGIALFALFLVELSAQNGISKSAEEWKQATDEVDLEIQYWTKQKLLIEVMQQANDAKAKSEKSSSDEAVQIARIDQEILT